MSDVPFPSIRRRLKLQSPEVYNAVLDEVIEKITPFLEAITDRHRLVINEIENMKAPGGQEQGDKDKGGHNG